MQLSEKISEVAQGLGCQKEEITFQHNTMFGTTFKTIQYYLVVFLTNQEMYYLDHENESSLNEADVIQDTAKGKMYAFC